MLRLVAGDGDSRAAAARACAGRYFQARAQELGLSRRLRGFARRSRSALVMTLTDDSAIAAAPMTGDSKTPKAG